MPRLEFTEQPEPTDVKGLWARLVRLVGSLTASSFIEGVALKPGAEGTLVPHGLQAKPKFYTAHLVGTSAGTAIVTKGPIGIRFLTLFTTADCTVDIEVKS